MARDPKRMALYEAIRKGQSKRQGGLTTVFFRPFGSGRARFGRRRKRDAALSRQFDGLGSAYPNRRRTPGLLRGRMPIPVRRIAIVVVAAAMIIFGSARYLESRGGRKWFFFGPKTETEQPGGGIDGNGSIYPSPAPHKTDITPVQKSGTPVQRSEPGDKQKEQPKPPATAGTNLIVIQTYKQRRDLEPVQEHFARNGIETEIVERGSYFFLVTKQLYQRCSADSTKYNPDYDGDVARRRIQTIGKTYKAPAGYETFRPKLFQDAYAEKVR